MKRFLFLLAATCSLAGDPVTIQPLTNWTTADGKPVAAGGWVEEKDGVLHRAAKGGGDLYSAKEYSDFEFSWEWKIAEGGNSGVKYRVISYGGENLGPEYQLLDDAKHPDAKVGPQRQSGSLYDFVAPDAALKKLNPPGQWNTAKVVVRGSKIEHWLNGAKVVEMDTSTDAWKAALAKSKFKNRTEFAQNKKGRILLQDHGNEVWFRNLAIKEL